MNDQPQSVRQQLPVLRTGGPVLAIIPQSIEGAYRLAKAAVASGLTHRDMATPERALMVILHGMEIGLPPMASLERIAIINGRRCVWGDAVPALAMDTGELVEWDEGFSGEGDSLEAFCRVARKTRAGVIFRKEARFSVEDAKKADLWDDRPKVKRKGRDGGLYEADNDSPWYRYQKRMLQMRARVAFRDLFSDKFMGLYIAEEMVRRDSDAEMRDVTPRDFKRVANPMDDAPVQTDQPDQELTHEDQQAIERGEEEREASGGRVARTAPQQQHDRAKSVASKQHPQDAPTEPAGEPKAAEATQQPTNQKNEPADVLERLAAEANAKQPETFQLEMMEPGPPKSISERAAAARGLPSPAEAKMATGGFYQEALALVANAVDAIQLNQWWRQTRKARIDAGMTASDLDNLTQTYSRKFLELSGS